MVSLLDYLQFNKQILHKKKSTFDVITVSLLWLLGAICDRLWYSLDRSVPAWDQADYLNGVLNYWNELQNPQWLDGKWWRNLWLLSNKIPPLHYIVTTPFINWFGLTEDAASLVMLLYSAMLLVAVYGLGIVLFNRRVAVIAAILCQLLPGLYYYRLEFLLDYPLTSVTVFSFWLLTCWKVTQHNTWWLAAAFGISFGCAVLLKQTALFFLFLPLVWLFVGYLKSLQWQRILQLVTSVVVGAAICYPWYRTNWLLILTSGKRATIDSAIAEGDPALNTLDAWLYYFKTLPYLLSWHLLIIPSIGIILYFIARTFKLNFYTVNFFSFNNSRGIIWLFIYLTGGYLLSSFNINKDARYILPLLPILALLIAIGLQAYSKRWRNYLTVFTVLLAIVLMLLNIFPLPGAIVAKILSPRTQHYPYIGQPYPHQAVIKEIIDTEPYLRTTLGVLPSTPAINQHNFSFYGGQQNFQVVGRQVGIRESEVVQDARSLNWFLLKTGDQGSIPEAQPIITNLIKESTDLQLHKSWQLPDNSELQLYRKTSPDVRLNIEVHKQNSLEKIQLEDIRLPTTATRGNIIPVTYQWLGNASQLARGILLLTWENIDNNDYYWISDRGIAGGMLADKKSNSVTENPIFNVTENTAILIPKTVRSGQYKLEATYLDRQTKKSYKIAIPKTIINIDANANIATGTDLERELDLVTQLRVIAPTMSSGIAALEPIFAQTARINQYDGKQDYLEQIEIALSYRLQHTQYTPQQKLDWNYAIALSQVLQQDVEGAIDTWNEIAKLDPNNPYNYAYLAFVYLYNWQPQPAAIALNKAETLNPDISEIKTLQGVAAFMQGNLIKAGRLLLNTTHS